MEQVLKNISQKKQLQRLNEVTKSTPDWLKRLKFGLLLGSTSLLIFFMGPIYIAILILLIQILCYREVLNIVIKANKNPNLPRLRITAWYLLLVWNYYLSGETFGDRFKLAIQKNFLFSLFLNHSRFTSFCLYFTGIILFVLGLRDKYDASRFRLLALMHILFIFLSLQTYMFLRCLLDGLIWIMVPSILVIMNDVFAYIFGKLFGKTPLIQVSPKKTREGYVCAAIFTIIGGFILSNYLSSIRYLICPTEYNELSNKIEVNLHCVPGDPFQQQNYVFYKFSFNLKPFVIHSFYFSLFASIVAPFGGFFASGFKRAFNVKDFANTIPGHGGCIDRFDCQFLMVMFVFTYMSSFIKNTPVRRIFKRVINMNDIEQVQFYNMLKQSLMDKHLLN